MKRKIIGLKSIALSLCIIISLITGCSMGNKDTSEESNSSNKSTIKLSGSTSVGPIIEKEAASFTNKNKNVRIEIQEIGSSAGIKNAISGVSQIGMSSRDLKEEEADKLKCIEIAYDGMAIILHPSNKVSNLSKEEIKKIYCGAITNWEDVGGENKSLVVVSREEGSGTRDGFQQIVGFSSKEITPKAIISDGNGNIKTTVASNPNAIGYISFEHVDETVKAIAVDGVMPNEKNVLNKSYTLWRPFILVYKEEYLQSTGKNFINYILSKEGQKIIEENGGIKVK